MNANLRKILLVGLLLILTGAGTWLYFFLNRELPETVTETPENLFPFGQVNSNNQNPNTGNQETINNDTVINQQETEDIPDITTPDIEGPRLRKISELPTGGFVPIIRQEEKEITDIEIDSEGNTVQTIRTIDVENQFVRYSAIEDGNIHEAKITPSDIENELLVENFIPNAEYAHFNSDGSRALFQYWNNEERVPETYLAHIQQAQLNINQCPFTFTTVEPGDDKVEVIDLHEFLNRIPQTRIARSGVNSPGNESSLATEATIVAIKNFQSLYQIDIDGKIGSGTQAKMLEVCNEQQRKIAREEFNALERKHTISGFFLPQNIIQIAMHPTSNQVFYLRKDPVGVIGILRDLVDETKETIFESPFSEWLVNWASDESIELTTKPSYVADGFSYQLSPDTGRYFKSLPERRGLTSLASPDNTKILVMESTERSVQMSIHDRKSNRTRPINIQTFVEKCTWSSNSKYLYCAVPGALAYGEEYPDTWYQGLETYTDSLWEINIGTSDEKVISDLSTEYGASIDVESIKIDPKNEYLYFIDKNSEHLWSYRLVDF